MTIKELEDIWNSMESYTGGYLLVSGEHPLSFHIGYQDNEKKSFVVLNTEKINGLKSSKAITADCVEMGSHEFILRFILNYPSLDEIFIKLCWDLMESSKTDLVPVNKILSQYNKWMRLLQKATNACMTPSQQKGLVGELLYFQESLRNMEAQQVLNAWVGPEGSDQDFIFETHWAEVKTVSIDAQDVQISSLQQLDRKDTGNLIVYFMDKTTSIGAQTLSLPEVIKKIRRQLPSAFYLDNFDCKLIQYGYSNRDEEMYCEIRYSLAECRRYMVNNEFPKLSRYNVPNALVDAKYSLNLLMLEKNRF